MLGPAITLRESQARRISDASGCSRNSRHTHLNDSEFFYETFLKGARSYAPKGRGEL